MVKRRSLILKCLSALLCGILALSTFVVSTFAYTIDDNGNLISDNLVNYKEINSDKYTDLGNNSFKLDWRGSVSTIRLPYSSFKANTQYSLTITKVNGAHYWAYQFYWNYTDNTSERFTNSQGIGDGTYSYTSASNKTLSSITIVLNYDAVFKDLMLNEGQPKSYEPYGTWFASKDANSSIYYLMNGANVELFSTNTNGGTYTSVMTESYNYVEGNLIDYSGIPNIYQYIHGHEDYYYRIKINLKQPTDKTIVFTFADNSSMEYVAMLSNSLNGQSFTFERTDSSLSLTCNTSSQYYDTITLSQLYSPDYIKFNMFISGDSYSYSRGYDDGYKEGHSDGQLEGMTDSYNSGERAGYQRGYNDGANSNLTTNGMKTLFNSILSYPVNMIKSVFNFEFMGINVASVIMFIVSIGIVVFVIKKFL